MDQQKKGVSPIGFFCIGFGAIVGVGWAVSINSWMTSCGGPIPAALGYFLVMLVLIPIGLCYAELVPALPVAGGGMAFAYKAFGSKLAFLAGWASLGGMIALIPWEAIQITDILGYLIPSINNSPVLYTIYGSDIHLTTVLIGLAGSLLLFALNMKGLQAAASIQKVLCFVLVGCAVIGSVAALIAGKWSNLTPIYDVTDPAIYGEGLKTVSHRTLFGGCFAIVAQAAFFISGFETIPQGVEDAGGDIKKVGKTVVLAIAFSCVFYAGLLFCFGYAWPWKEFASMPRPAAASMFLQLYPGTTGKVLYWILVIGAVAGLLTSWNGFFTASANMLMSMSRGRLITPFFRKQNAQGVAVRGQVLCLILSVFGPFLGPNLIDSITCFSAIAFTISWAMCAWSLIGLRKRFPDLERPYKILGGLPMAYFAAIAMTLIVIFMFVPSSPFYVGSLSVETFIGWIAIGALLFLAAYPGRKKMTPSQLEDAVFGKLVD